MWTTLRRISVLLLALVASTIVGCATMGERSEPPLVPSKNQTRTGPFVVFTNEPIPPDANVIKQLHTLENEFSRTLDVNITEINPPIEVYLLTDRKSFEHFLTFYYPELPQRRAFFLAQGDRRVIYTFVSDKLDVDVRHESTHALLSYAFGDLPMWLDEGLAEYFECPGENGRNPEDLRKLAAELANGWKPNFERLEKLKFVKDMTPRDYHEAWAWVHLALSKSTPAERKAFRSYLVAVGNGEAKSIEIFFNAKSDALADQLITHVKGIPDDAIVRASDTQSNANKPASNTVIRLQEASNDVAASKPRPKRGLFGRIRDFFTGE